MPKLRSPEFQRWRRISRLKRATIASGTEIQKRLERGGFRWRAAMLTLTYAQDGTWQPRDVSRLIKHIREWAGRRGVETLPVVWVAELTMRGRVHYHLMLWLPPGLTLPKPDKQGWWPHGSTRIEWARKSVGYLAKYTSKGDVPWLDGEYKPRQFPKGCRIHGRSGLEKAERAVVAWWCLPRYVREVFDTEGETVRRARGGGWLCTATGEWLAGWSPFAGGQDARVA